LRRAVAIVALVALALAAAGVASAGSSRAPGKTRVLALVPKPGFPARAYVHPNGRIYEGTYVNPLGDEQASRVFEYTAKGALVHSWTVRGQDLGTEHGVQVATSDAKGRLVLLDRTPARALTLNLKNGNQRRYAQFADLPTCPPGGPPDDCSPALRDEPPSANYAAWGRDGSLYVTDFLQAVIWRVPPGGGAARVWLADRRLDGDMFGTTGIVLGADRRSLVFAQQSSAGLGDENPTTGKLYTVPIRRSGSPGAITQLWESGPADGPDGFAVARSGNLYVALAGANQIAEVAPDGTEVQRFGAPVTGDNGSAVPFDTPSSAMFLGRRLIVANQSYFAGPVSASSQAILKVFAGERGSPEFIPPDAGHG
jgi:sugar lactone lactonase YvrE